MPGHPLPDQTPSATVLLYLAGGDRDAGRLLETFEQIRPRPCHLLLAHDAEDARAILRFRSVDAVLIRVGGQNSGLEAADIFREIDHKIPMVALASEIDGDSALQLLRYGVQDYLEEQNLTPDALRRALGFAMGARRNTDGPDLPGTMRYSPRQAPTDVTATLAGIGPLKSRLPELFRQLAASYSEFLDTYVEYLLFQSSKPVRAMERTAVLLGDAGAGPRDLIELHTSAMVSAATGQSRGVAKTMAAEGRLLALEMMGLLVDYYRVGLRCRFTEKVQS